MAFSRTDRWSRKLDGIEPVITRYHRWSTGEIVLLNPNAMDRLGYATTKQMIQSEDR